MDFARTAAPVGSMDPTAILPLVQERRHGLLEDPVKKRVLVYENESDSQQIIASCLGEGFNGKDFEFEFCRSFGEVSEILRDRLRAEVDLLIWGISQPCTEDLVSLRALRESYIDLRVMLLAPQEALAHASLIKKINADAFVLKPVRLNDLKGGIEKSLKRPKIESSIKETIYPSSKNLGALVPVMTNVPVEMASAAIKDGTDLGIIGSSAEMLKVVSLIRKIGRSNVSVLITGESGTGKEMVAQAIHRASDRSGKPFVAINCAAIPKELLESELFGHAKGAFTGATTTRRGLFEEAHEGTILLDEIGDLPLPLQAKILRLIQTRQVKPLGQNLTKEVDVRILSATHKNLKTLIQRGEFREDLYYRLNVMPIHLPPLRDRQDDIITLAEYFLNKTTDRLRVPRIELTRRACTKLLSLYWKGNVRELENVMERAVVLSDGKTISEAEIVVEEMEQNRMSAEDLFNAGMTLKDIEREYIRYVLQRTGNRKEAATRILGIDRKTLYRKEKTFGFRPHDDFQ